MRIEFLGTSMDLLSARDTVDRAVEAMRSRQPLTHVAMNVAKFVRMRRDAELRRDVIAADIIGVDGMGLVLALRLFGRKDAERVAGVDLMFMLLDRCAELGLRPFILGARREVLEQAAQAARRRWPGLEFAGLRDGYFSVEEESDVVELIRGCEADCLFVAMPTPRKERFLLKNRDRLDIPFVMGVGGSVDVLAGSVPRAPVWMQRHGLEWLHRLLQEPRKMFWRYTSTNVAFAVILARAAFARLLGRAAIRLPAES
ncbi:WecB/TagA/CpsF family glycosyltransferase [Sphingosinicella terrae]|uniref:WecB/TagA/CpsF family glycosyltransferase n=1 Tax=Sphingosinicella terrae TaxID=2172047 RepID=UPI00254844D0|nr:WecB/TagA/CpsF family glycosyltransferase [Sphingosinicella terrae]